MFILSGCYNNTNIRTSKILEEGEKVISFNGSLNIASEGLGNIVVAGSGYYANRWIVPTGLAGLRGELSLLKGYKNSEAGFSGGVGFGWNPALHIGLEYKKYINLNNLSPLKAGIHIEVNEMVGLGTAIQSVQSIKTTSSKKNPFYGGFHSIYTYGSHVGYKEFGNISYDFLMKGIGITFGMESFFRRFGLNTSTILQIDASLLSSSVLNIKGAKKGESGKIIGEYPTISASLGFNFFNTGSKKGSPLTPLPKPKINPELEFDPETGSPIEKTSSGLEFDPETGEPAKQTNQELRFDPETGELLLNNNQL